MERKSERVVERYFCCCQGLHLILLKVLKKKNEKLEREREREKKLERGRKCLKHEFLR